MMRGLKFVMDKRVSLEDLRTFFQGQLCSHNNRPIFVRRINEERSAKLVDLLTQKTYVLENLDELQVPMRRIGMVNCMGSVIYVERTPQRKMQMGLSSSNVKFSTLAVEYPEGRDHTYRRVAAFDNVDIGNAYMNIYPSIKECLKHNKEFGGAMAFDKQFAIDEESKVFYKTKRVGTMPRGCSTIERIVFENQYTHLSLLLGGAYEKDLSAFAQACSS
jgi:hypothetical protein